MLTPFQTGPLFLGFLDANKASPAFPSAQRAAYPLKRGLGIAVKEPFCDQQLAFGL